VKLPLAWAPVDINMGARMPSLIHPPYRAAFGLESPEPACYRAAGRHDTIIYRPGRRP